MAQELKKPYFLLAGRKNGVNKRPAASLAGDKLYNWTWPNMKKLIHSGR